MKKALQEVKECYDLTAGEYSLKFLNELQSKPFDRMIIDRFCGSAVKDGVIYDFCCGPGQTTDYVYKKYSGSVTGFDISENMIKEARKNYPVIDFQVGNVLKTALADHSSEGIICFYGIVHMSYCEIKRVFNEWKRLLKPGGVCLFSFHEGRGSLRVENFLDVQGASATWRFLSADKVLGIAEKCGFKIDEAVIRYPYKDVEHPSKRAYVIMSPGS